MDTSSIPHFPLSRKPVPSGNRNAAETESLLPGAALPGETQPLDTTDGSAVGRRDHVSPEAPQQSQAKANAADRNDDSQMSLFQHELREAFGSHQHTYIPLRDLPKTPASAVHFAEIEPDHKRRSGATSKHVEGDIQAFRSIEMWRPIWLRPVVLVGFIVVFALILTTLILLYRWSKTHHGISTQISSNHYSWTYDPTAVLLVLVGFWRPVDYYCKLLAPWDEVYNHESGPQRSLLLDYVFPILPSALLRACRNKHWTVVSSILSLLLLRVALIFSTGLLVLRPTKMTREGLRVHTNTIFVRSNATARDYEASPLLTYHGILDRGLGYPYGTSDGVAFDGLSLQDIDQQQFAS